ASTVLSADGPPVELPMTTGAVPGPPAAGDAAAPTAPAPASAPATAPAAASTPGRTWAAPGVFPVRDGLSPIPYTPGRSRTRRGGRRSSRAPAAARTFATSS